MKDYKMTIQGIQEKIEEDKYSIFEIEEEIRIKSKNGIDISDLEGQIKIIEHNISFAVNEIKRYQNEMLQHS